MYSFSFLRIKFWQLAFNWKLGLNKILLVDGSDLPRLRLYYSTLEQVGGDAASRAQQHVIALDLLIQHNIARIDFNRLCSGSSEVKMSTYLSVKDFDEELLLVSFFGIIDTVR